MEKILNKYLIQDLTNIICEYNNYVHPIAKIIKTVFNNDFTNNRLYFFLKFDYYILFFIYEKILKKHLYYRSRTLNVYYFNKQPINGNLVWTVDDYFRKNLE